MNLTPINIILWSLVAFVAGSIPFSVWVSRLFGKDPRKVGDGNAGAINALKAGGWRVGLIAFLLDVSKGVVPVGLAYQIWGWRGYEIVAVAVAALVGSMFTPFLKFRGGKSLSVSLGIWIGLTIWEAPIFILVSLTVAYLVQTVSGWAVVVSILSLVAYLLLKDAGMNLWLFLGIQALLLGWKHWDDLRQRPHWREWLTRK